MGFPWPLLPRAGVCEKVAVVMIGTNNTGHLLQEPAEVADGVRTILDILRHQTPDTKILLLGIFPRGAMPLDEKRLNNVAINQLIRRFHDGEKVYYLDMPDLLHLNEEGYERWARAIEPKLVELGL